MKRSTDRILVTHVGSLPRPSDLIELYRDNAPDDKLLPRLRSAIADVVRRQLDAGIDIVNDGEFGKSHWIRYVAERLAGVEARLVAGRTPAVFAGRDRERFPEFYAEYDKTLNYARAYDFVVTGPIAYKGRAFIERDIANLKAALAGATVAGAFLPVVAPASLLPELKDEHYGDTEKLAFAVADALREEYRAIVAAGLVAQIDDAWLPAMYDRMVPPGTPADYRRWAEMCVAAPRSESASATRTARVDSRRHTFCARFSLDLVLVMFYSGGRWPSLGQEPRRPRARPFRRMCVRGQSSPSRRGGAC